MSNLFYIKDYRDILVPENTSLIIADPVYGTDMVLDIVKMIKTSGIPGIVFSSVNDLYNIAKYCTPCQTAFWTKPVSTKNTKKRYSCFVEAITFYGDIRFHKELHWSCRSGIFTDSLLSNGEHQWKKPDSLIEKLVLNHYPGHGIVYDPCAGSGTVHSVCIKHGIPSVSCELDAKYAR